MTLNDEFKKFLDTDKSREEFLKLQLDRAIDIMKRAYPFIETWHESSHAGTGYGALNVMTEINKFIKEME